MQTTKEMNIEDLCKKLDNLRSDFEEFRMIALNSLKILAEAFNGRKETNIAETD